MANFCNKCGAPVSGIFCVKCGADTRAAANPQPSSAAAEPPAPAVPTLPPAVSAPPAPATRFCNGCGAPVTSSFCRQCGADTRAAASPMPQPAASSAPLSTAAPAKGSPLVKILVGFLVVIIVLGALAAGGVYYVVYRVKKKVHEVAAEIPDVGSSAGSIFHSNPNGGSSSGSNDSSSNGGLTGDPCRLLSKQEVGRAVGVEIVATQSTDGGCSYLAKGDTSTMTARHMTAIAGARGADSEQQKMIQNITGGMFKSLQEESHQQTSDSNGNVPVFVFAVDNHSANAQMQVNRKVLGGLGPGAQDFQGIGDQAFDVGGAQMMVLKGDKLIRIMYSTCPCTVEAIEPLAKQLADRL